jgi:hypothetical protein
MSEMMQTGFLKNPARLSNGFTPIDSACLAHGSDLA